MLKIVRATALMMLLAVAATAGETPNNPPCPPDPVMQETTTDADTLPETTQETTADSFGETLLNLLDSVLALL